MRKKNSLLMLVAMMLLGFQAQAQMFYQDRTSLPDSTIEIIIGTGTSYGYTAPFNNFYNNSWNQTIYSVNDIVVAGNISTVSYECYSTDASYSIPSLNIYMGHTSMDANTSSSWLNTTDLQLVYSGINVASPTTTGWFTITLDTTFFYNGSDNLVIAVSKTNDDYSSSLKWKYTAVNNSFLYRQDDDDASYAQFPGTLSGSTSSNRANIKMTLELVEGICQKPFVNIDSVTSSSVQVSWNAGTAISWNLKYGAPGFDPITEGSVVSLSDTVYAISGLNANTSYDVCVEAFCDSITSSGWKRCNFNTACGMQSIPYVDNFDSYIGVTSTSTVNLPDCWSHINTGTTAVGSPNVYSSTSSAYSGSNFLRFYVYYSSAYSDQYAVFPPMENVSTLQLTCMARESSTTSTYVGNIVVGVMTDPADAATFVSVDTIAPTTINYEEFVAYLNSYTGAGQYIALKAPKPTSGYNIVCLDNLAVESIPSCIKPTDFVLTSVGLNDASFSWVDMSNAANFEIEYDLTGFALGTGIRVGSISGTTYSVSGLTNGDSYDFYLRSMCSATDSSAWVGPLTLVPGEVTIGAPISHSNTPPFCNYYHYSWLQSIYTAQEIASSNVITSIAFNCQASGAMVIDTLRIYMAETNLTDCQQWVPENELVLVYSANSVSTIGSVTGWNTITLDEPFLLSGNKNLAVVVSKSMASYNSSVHWYYEDAVGMSAYERSDSYPESANYPTDEPSQNSQRANIKLSFVSAAGFCAKPNDLTISDLAITTAKANWVAGNEETAWNLKYGVAGFDVETSGTLVTDIDSTFYFIGGLTSLTSYDVYIQSQCTDSTISDWRGPVTFTTLPTCAEPTNMNIVAMNDNSVTLAWTAGYQETTWEVEYGTSGFAHGAGTIINDTLNPITVGGLTSGETYDFYVRAFCDQNLQSEWIGPLTLTLGEISIGNGQESYSYLPFYGLYAYGYSQQIYDASEMAGACMITEVKFYCSVVPVSSTGAVKIWMANTDKSVFASNSDYVQPSELSLVYDMGDGVAWTIQQGWNTLVLDEPFVYDGNSNLVIAYYEGLTGYKSSEWYAHATTAHKSLLHYSDTQSSVSYTSPSTATGSIKYEFKRNDIKLTTIPVNPNYCYMPIQVESVNVDSTSFTLNWSHTDSTFAGTYNLIYGLKGFDMTTDGVAVNNLTQATYDITNLIPNTQYDIYLQSVCSDSSYSSWRGPLEVRTLCGSYTNIPYAEDFDGFAGTTSSSSGNNLPDCWNYINTGSSSYTSYPVIYSSTSSAYSGNNMLRFYSSSSTSYGDQYAILPPTNNVSALQLSLKARIYSTSTSYTSTMTVGVMDNETNAASFVPVALIEPTTTTYQDYIVYFSNYTGTGKYIALKVEHPTTGTNSINVDNLVVDFIPACPPVSALVVNSVDTVSATLAWITNGSETSWTIQYGYKGFALGSGDTVVVNTNPATIVGLSNSTGYDVYVKPNCEDGSWTGPVSFYTTQVPATLPYNCGFENSEEESLRWTLENGSQTNQWSIGHDFFNYAAYQGNAGLFISYDGGQSNYYTNQTSAVYAYRSFDLTAGTYVLNFKWRCMGEDGDDYIRAFLVPASVTLTAGQTNGITATTTPDGWIALGEQFNQDTAWLSYHNEELMVENDGIYNLVFYWKNDASTASYPAPAVDKIEIFSMTCVMPTDVSCTAADETTATIAWTENGTATSWNIEYGLKGYIQGEGTVVAAGSNPYTITGLTASTRYDVYVQANCGEQDGLSGWRGPVTFNTASCAAENMCPIYLELRDQVFDGWNGDAAINVYTNDIFVASYTLNSGSNHVSYTVPLCPGTAGFTWTTGMFDNECSFIILDANHDTLFVCAEGNAVNYSPEEEFFSFEHSCGTQTCSAPTNVVAVQNITAAGELTQGIKLTWSATAEAVSYNVYRNGEQVATGLTSTTYTETPSTTAQYCFTVKAVCEQGESASSAQACVDYDATIGIAENAAEQAHIYPNPTNDKVKVEAAEMTRINVMNVIGQTLFEEEVDADAYEFDFAGYEAGVYMMRIETTTGNATKRVTVVK